MERKVSFENIKNKYTKKLDNIEKEIKNTEDDLYNCCAEIEILQSLIDKNNYFKDLYDSLYDKEKELNNKLNELNKEKGNINIIINRIKIELNELF